jgi:hypothetical protein
MGSYRAIFLSEDSRLIGWEEIACASDIEAVRHAHVLLLRYSHVELWGAGRRLCRLQRHQPDDIWAAAAANDNWLLMISS